MNFESSPAGPPAHAPAPSPGPARVRRNRKGKRWWVIALIAIPVLATLLLAGAWIGVTSYLRGEAFRKLVRDQTNNALKADGEFEKFSWTGSTVYSPGYVATGRDDGYFERLAASTLRADIDLDGMKRGYWTIRSLEIGSLHLELGNPRGDGDAKTDHPEEEIQPTGSLPPADQIVPPSGAEAQPDLAAQVAVQNPVSPTTEPERSEDASREAAKKESKAKDEKKGKGFLEGWLPEDLELAQIQVRDARIQWAPLPAQAGELSGTEMELRPMDPTNLELGWEVKGHNGEFQQEGLPKFAVVDYDIRAKADEVFVRRAVLRGPKDSLLEANGTIALQPEVSADATVKLSGYPLTELLQGDWKKRLEGRLNGEVHVTGAPTSEDAVAEGRLHIQDGVLQGLPMLEQIAKYTKSQRFLRMTLDEASTEFRRQGQLLDLKNIVMESKGLMRLTGGCKVDGEALDGTFRVGVTSTSLRWLIGAEKHVFTESADGYLWTTMRVTGTTAKPKEDLTERLVAAAGEELVSTVKDVADQLKQGADENTKKAIDTGLDILNQLLK